MKRESAALIRMMPALLLPLGVSGCTHAPAINVFGSFFPSWMLCAIIGAGVAMLAHRLLAPSGFNKTLPAPFAVYLAFAIATAFGLWLIWLQ